jgi:hypothetical protein
MGSEREDRGNAEKVVKVEDHDEGRARDEELVVVPNIDFSVPTGDLLANARKGFGLQRLGATGPSASVASVSQEAKAKDDRTAAR